MIERVMTENVDIAELSDVDLKTIVSASFTGNLDLENTTLISSDPCKNQRLNRAIRDYLSNLDLDIQAGSSDSGGSMPRIQFDFTNGNGTGGGRLAGGDGSGGVHLRNGNGGGGVHRVDVDPLGGMPGSRCASVAPDRNIRCASAVENIRCASAADSMNHTNIRCASSARTIPNLGAGVKCALTKPVIPNFDFGDFNPKPKPSFPPIGPIGPIGPEGPVGGIRCAECPEPKPVD